jgi:hypothetical protein
MVQVQHTLSYRERHLISLSLLHLVLERVNECTVWSTAAVVLLYPVSHRASRLLLLWHPYGSYPSISWLLIPSTNGACSCTNVHGERVVPLDSFPPCKCESPRGSHCHVNQSLLLQCTSYNIVVERCIPWSSQLRLAYVYSQILHTRP